MENEHKPDEQVEEQTSQETVDETTQNNETDETVNVEEFKKLQETNKQLYARLKKAEEAKGAKSEETQTYSSDVDDLDKLEFFSQGNTKEDWMQLQTIMKGKDVSFSEALEDPLYQGYKEKREAEKRKEQSQMPASNARPQQKTVKAGMSEEDHKKQWKERMGR